MWGSSRQVRDDRHTHTHTRHMIRESQLDSASCSGCFIHPSDCLRSGRLHKSDQAQNNQGARNLMLSTSAPNETQVEKKKKKEKKCPSPTYVPRFWYSIVAGHASSKKGGLGMKDCVDSGCVILGKHAIWRAKKNSELTMRYIKKESLIKFQHHGEKPNSLQLIYWRQWTNLVAQ